MMTNSRSIPITLVTGFLGSGKTTTILNYLNDKASEERVAVLVNDFGRIGVDTLTLRQAQTSSTVVHQVPGGCICCTAAVGMTLALMNIIETEDPDRIIIEPTGIAKPREIERLVRSSDFKQRVHLAQTIALVDIRRFAEGTFEGLNIFTEQIEEADLVVGNFSDRVEVSQIEIQRTRLQNLLKPSQSFLTTTRGRISKTQFQSDRHLGAIGTRPRFVRSSGADKISEPEHSKNYRETGQQWSSDHDFDFERLKTEIQKMIANPGLLRVKGQFRTSTGYLHLEWVQSDAEASWTEISNPLELSSFIEVVAQQIDQTHLEQFVRLTSLRS